MKTVKVILRQPMDNLGEAGEIVTVKPGYARNYLLPRGFAYEATTANVRALEAYDWPGNVRELRNVIERALITAGTGPLSNRRRTACVAPLIL